MAFVVLIEMVLVLRPQPQITQPLAYELKALPRHSSGPLVEEGVARDHGTLDSFGEAFGLSALEVDIVRLIAQGRSRGVIAKQLSYSENTVRNYTRNIYRKVGVHSKQDLLDALDRFDG